MAQSIVQIIVFLLVLGLVLTFAGPYIPPQIMTLIVAVAVIGGAIWLLKLAGWVGGPPVA